jgi:hypothetical protein
MSPREIGHRTREAFRRKISRFSPVGWTAFDLGDGPLEILHPLRNLADATWPSAVASVVDAAADQTQLSFLGQAWPAEARLGRTPGLWWMDPVSGTSWPGPDQFCFDVKWRGETAKGDVKFVLELNRLQSLQPLAALALRDGNAEHAENAAKILLSWMEDNPPFAGVNWLSGIELALRLVSAAFVATALEVTLPGHAYRKPLRAFMAAHAYWLDRFPSLHSSANNHRVSEGLGLWVAAETVPDMPKAEHFRRHGQKILADASASQFHGDGTGVEQSPTYAAFTLEMILFGMSLGRSSGRPMSCEVDARVERAASHLRALLDDAGRPPRIGDDDEGQVIACPSSHDDRYVASIVAAAAGMLDKPQLAPPDRSPQLRDIVFGSPASGMPVAPGVRCFIEGGYTVIRERMAERRMLLVMDHGPIGMAPLAAHGHADALSVWLHLDDQPVFVDAGTYRYHVSGPWRERLRSTQSHNTLALSGQDQSLSAGPFNWKHKARCRLVSLDMAPDSWMVAAAHDGYRGRLGTMHQRTCRRLDGGFEIEDVLDAVPTGIEIAINFLLHPSLSARAEGSEVEISNGSDRVIKMTAPPDTAVEIVSAASIDGGNAYSGRYNSLQPATRIVFRPERGVLRHLVQVRVLAPSGPA